MTDLRFEVPLPPRGLRVNRATGCVGWRASLRRAYQEEVWCAGRTACDAHAPGQPPWERARLRLTWHHAGVAPDADNALASLKALIDVLHTRSARPLGIVVDDAPEHLQIERVQMAKVRRRAEERVRVEVARLSDTPPGVMPSDSPT